MTDGKLSANTSVNNRDATGRPKIISLAPHEAIIASPQMELELGNVHATHPLFGPQAQAVRKGRPNQLCIAPPETVDFLFPQLDVSCGPDWAVWPHWRFAITGARSKTPFAWETSGLTRVALPGAALLHTPDLQTAPRLAQAALQALQHRFGPLPWSTVNLLVELQTTDYGRDKGYAFIYDCDMWCRAMVRPNAGRNAPLDPRTAIELIVHEMLHHVIEFDTPAGHFLTEGLVTWLARKLVVETGHAKPHWLVELSKQAARDLRMWQLQTMSLREVPKRFFVSEPARRVSYRKGFLLSMDLDHAMNGRLADLCVSLVARARRIGHRLTERQFLQALPRPARRIYIAATGVPRPIRARGLRAKASITLCSVSS